MQLINLIARLVSGMSALSCVDIFNALVIENCVFGISKRFDIPLSGTVDIVIDPSAFDRKRLLFLPVTFRAFGAGPIHIDIYFGTEYSGGTEIESINRDLTSSTEAKVKIYLDPTIIEAGTKLPTEFVILSDGVAAVSNIGGETKEDLIFNGRTDGNYLFRLTNQEASAAQGFIASNWAEI